MEKLNSTDFIEKLKIFENPLKNLKENNSPGKQNKEFFVYALIFLIVLSECFIYFEKVAEALYLYTGLLMALSLISLLTKDQEISNISQVFLLFPILRLINFSMPFFSESPILSLVFVYTPMVVPISFIVINQKFTREKLGITSKNMLYYFPLSIFIGLILGKIEYSNLGVVQLIPDFSLLNILILAFIMVFFVAAIEEIIFRSILQTKLEEIFGMGSGLIFSSLIFGIMNSGYGNFYEILYAVFIGLFIGYIFQKTRSLPFIIMIHGFMNIFCFGIFPYLSSGVHLF